MVTSKYILLLYLIFNRIASIVSFHSYSQSIPNHFTLIKKQKTYSQTKRYNSPLPEGISPFEKSISKSIDVQANFRKQAKPAVDAAISDGIKLMEIEFPPLIGGDQVCLCLCLCLYLYLVSVFVSLLCVLFT